MPCIFSCPTSTHSPTVVNAVGSIEIPSSAKGQTSPSLEYQQPASTNPAPSAIAGGNAKKKELLVSAATVPGRAATRRVSGMVMPSSGMVCTMKNAFMSSEKPPSWNVVK